MTRWRWLPLAATLLVADASADRTGARRAAQLGGGTAAAERGDAARTARTRALPSSPKEALRVSLGARVVAGAVATTDRLVVAAGRELCFVDARSAAVTRVDLGGQAAHPPAVDSAGRAWTLTAQGELVIVDADGGTVARRALPTKDPKLRAAPVMFHGSLVVATGTQLLELDVDGAVRAHASLPDAPAIALASDGQRVFAASDLGRVFSWDLARAPVELPRLGGLPTSALTVSPAGPLVVVDGARLVRLSQGAPTWSTLLRSGSALLEGPLAVTTAGECVVETTAGLLLGATLDGKETRRVELPSPRAAHAESIGGVGPGPVVDDGGRVAFVRGSGEVGIVERDTVSLADKPACREPLGLTASSAGLFVTCVDGLVVGYR